MNKKAGGKYFWEVKWIKKQVENIFGEVEDAAEREDKLFPLPTIFHIQGR